MIRKQVLSLAFMTASVLCMLAVMPVLAQTGEPSLGEVARKNRAAKSKRPASKERKEEISRPMSTATVTDYGSSASLGTSSPEASSSATPASGEPAPSESTPQPDAAAPKSEPPANDRVAQLKKDQASLNQIIEKMKEKLATETVDSRRQTYGEVLRNAEQELEKKQQELSEAERSAPKK